MTVMVRVCRKFFAEDTVIGKKPNRPLDDMLFAIGEYKKGIQAQILIFQDLIYEDFRYYLISASYMVRLCCVIILNQSSMASLQCDLTFQRYKYISQHPFHPCVPLSSAKTYHKPGLVLEKHSRSVTTQFSVNNIFSSTRYSV